MSQQQNQSLLTTTDKQPMSGQQMNGSVTEHDEEDNAFKLTPLQKLIDKVGGEGKYQFRSFLIMAATWFLTSWLLLGIAFFFDDSITCKQYDNQQDCMKYVCDLPKDQWKSAIIEHPNSIIFEFQPYLLCDSTSTILQAMVFFGSLIGFFIIPFVADNLGRKIAMQVSWAICTLGVFLLVIANSEIMIGIGYFLAGFGSNPAITLCFSFINEQCLYKSRQRYGVFVQIFLALGESTIALMFIPKGSWGWRWVMIVLLLMVIVVNGFLFYLLETPKFLFNKSKQKTLITMNIIAARNKKQPLTIQQIHRIELGPDHQNKSSLIDLFKYKSLRMITIATGFGFLGIQTIYYFTSLNLSNAGFNMLINQQIIGGSQIAGYVIAEIIISKIKRRPLSILGMGISSGVCLVLALLTSIGHSTGFLIMETIGLIINRLVVCCFWSIFFVYVAQLYPTQVRSLGYGWVSAIGMIGSALCPFLIQFSQSTGINTWINPAVIGIVGTVFLFFLPQTYGQQLQDEIQQLRGKVSQTETDIDTQIKQSIE